MYLPLTHIFSFNNKDRNLNEICKTVAIKVYFSKIMFSVLLISLCDSEGDESEPVSDNLQETGGD